MTDSQAAAHIRPYSFDIELAPSSDKFFQWTIRKSGKIFQRSDRTYASAAEALKKVEATVERLLTDRDR